VTGSGAFDARHDAHGEPHRDAIAGWQIGLGNPSR
jgi:hypothetical protein